MTEPKGPPGPNTSAGNIPPVGGPPPQPHQQRPSNTAPIARAAVSRQDLMSVQQLDPATLDPNKHYRWVRTVARDDDGSISVRQKEFMGYQIEHLEEGGVRTLAK